MAEETTTQAAEEAAKATIVKDLEIKGVDDVLTAFDAAVKAKLIKDDTQRKEKLDQLTQHVKDLLPSGVDVNVKRDELDRVFGKAMGKLAAKSATHDELGLTVTQEAAHQLVDAILQKNVAEADKLKEHREGVLDKVHSWCKAPEGKETEEAFSADNIKKGLKEMAESRLGTPAQVVERISIRPTQTLVGSIVGLIAGIGLFRSSRAKVDENGEEVSKPSGLKKAVGALLTVGAIAGAALALKGAANAGVGESWVSRVTSGLKANRGASHGIV